MTPWLIYVAEAWWGWMAPMSLQFAALVVIAAIADRLLSRWTWPEVPLLLWLLVMVKLLVPPVMHSPVSVVHLAPAGALAVANASADDPTWIVPVFVAWLIGMALFAVAALCRYRRLTREWSAGAECSLEPELMRLAASAAQRMGLKRLPLIQVRSGAAGPGVVGFLRPVVVLPEELVSCARPEQVEHVLLHELAHVRRGDPMTSLACLVLQLLYWFHPLVWVARRRLATCVEVCCDRRVALLLEGSAPAYRRTLLELARALVHRPALGRIGFVHRHSQLLARLEWLERPFTHRSVVHKTVTVSLLVVMLVCCLPLAPASFQPPRVSLPESPEGCLRLRYAVFSALAQEEVNGERFVASSVQSDQIHVNGG